MSVIHVVPTSPLIAWTALVLGVGLSTGFAWGRFIRPFRPEAV